MKMNELHGEMSDKMKFMNERIINENYELKKEIYEWKIYL